MTDRQNAVLEKLLAASEGVVPAPGLEPWDYGWAYEKYRRSGKAVLSSRAGSVTMTPEAFSVWEEAAQTLRREPSVQARWDAEEFWGLLASLTVAASEHNPDTREVFLASRLDLFRSAGMAFTVQLIANVTWTSAPLVIGDVVIGRAGENLFDAAESAAAGRKLISKDQRERWLDEQIRPRLEATGFEPVALCCWTLGQRAKAVAETERKLRDVVDLPLLLERDLVDNRIYRRGEANRPGVRGLTLDRGAVERALQETSSSLELAAFPLTFTEVLEGSGTVHWYSSEPFPLGELYSQQYLREAVRTCQEDDPVARRVRLAARWFAEAHYTNADDDAALALGVSLDALLSGKQALPSGAMADRLALLERNPSGRKAKRKKYFEFFSVRSSIAHGGRSSKLDQKGLLKEFSQLVHVTAWRLIEVKRAFHPVTENDVDELFDDLRLGTRVWP